MRFPLCGYANSQGIVSMGYKWGKPVGAWKRDTDFLELREGRAEYGNRTRLLGLGSRCTTDVLIPQKSRYRDSNPGPIHYE